MRMVREWRHIKLLKRMLDKSPKDLIGSGTTTGLNFTPGLLAVQCPACPWPGLNMPPGWENDPDKPYVSIHCSWEDH